MRESSFKSVEIPKSNAVVERVNRTLRDKLHRYFTYKNTYHYLDVLPKFIKGYNASVRSSTGMQGKAARTRSLSKPVSGGAIRAHQQGEDEIRERR